MFGRIDQTRQHIPKVLILLTDGKARSQRTALQEAALLKRVGVTIIGIAAGTPHNIDRFITNLYALAMRKSLVFKTSFTGLDTITDSVTTSTCELGKITFCS